MILDTKTDVKNHQSELVCKGNGDYAKDVF